MKNSCPTESKETPGMEAKSHSKGFLKLAAKAADKIALAKKRKKK